LPDPFRRYPTIRHENDDSELNGAKIEITARSEASGAFAKACDGAAEGGREGGAGAPGCPRDVHGSRWW
jgi:hypothetical protein